MSENAEEMFGMVTLASLCNAWEDSPSTDVLSYLCSPAWDASEGLYRV